MLYLTCVLLMCHTCLHVSNICFIKHSHVLHIYFTHVFNTCIKHVCIYTYVSHMLNVCSTYVQRGLKLVFNKCGHFSCECTYSNMRMYYKCFNTLTCLEYLGKKIVSLINLDYRNNLRSNQFTLNYFRYGIKHYPINLINLTRR